MTKTDISKVHLDKVDIEVVKASLDSLNIGWKKTATLKELVEALQAHYEEEFDADAQYYCDACEAIADECDTCPYCGKHHEESSDTESKAVEEEVDKVEDEEAEVSIAVKEAEAVKTPEPESKAEPKDEPAKSEHPVGPGGRPLRPKPPKIVKKPKEAKAAESDPRQVDWVDETEKKEAKKPKEEKTSIVALEDDLAANEKQLDESVSRIHALVKTTAQYFMQLGQELLDVKDNRLWTARRDKDGSPAYESFANFVDAELKMTTQWAGRLMNVASKFDPSEVEDIDITKLTEIAKLPEKEQRSSLLEAAKEGATVSELKAKIREFAKAEKETEEPDEDAPAASTPPPKAAVSPKPDAVEESEVITTVVLASEKSVVQMFAGDTRTKAKTLDDVPTGLLRCATGVNLKFTMERNDKGNVVLIVEVVQ